MNTDCDQLTVNVSLPDVAQHGSEAARLAIDTEHNHDAPGGGWEMGVLLGHV